MDLKTMLTAFGALLLAEMGDKTQLAVITLCASSKSPASVFVGATLALVVVTGLGVIFGRGVVAMVPEVILHRLAGTAFIAIGAWMWVRP
jgi:putative Ca2+/H+ antiporter (TMEM165/GDT1 family)